MDWLQSFMIAGSTIGACYWMHREHTTAMKSISDEMRDFHGRLCTLEERYVQMMQRILEKNQK